MQVKKQQLELSMEQQTGSKLGKWCILLRLYIVKLRLYIVKLRLYIVKLRLYIATLFI